MSTEGTAHSDRFKPDDLSLAINYVQAWRKLFNMMSSFGERALKALLNDIMCYFVCDHCNNWNEYVGIAIKNVKRFQSGLTK